MNQRIRIMTNLFPEDIIDKKYDNIIRILYATLLIGAAFMIFVLFEGLFEVSFYFIYIFLGVIAAAAVFLFIHLLLRKYTNFID